MRGRQTSGTLAVSGRGRRLARSCIVAAVVGLAGGFALQAEAAVLAWDLRGTGGNQGPTQDYADTTGTTWLTAAAFVFEGTGWLTTEPGAATGLQIHQTSLGIGLRSGTTFPYYPWLSVPDSGQIDNINRFEVLRLQLPKDVVVRSALLTATFTDDQYRIWGNDTGELPDVAAFPDASGALNGTELAAGTGSILATRVDFSAGRPFEYLFFSGGFRLHKGIDFSGDGYRIAGLTVNDASVVNPVVTPVPASWWLLGSALAALGIIGRNADSRSPNA